MRNFGLIGFPLGHSFSKRYFSEKFETEKIDARYELYELEKIEKFSDLIQDVELSGLSVTIPYKEQVIPYLHELDETAAQIGAVNAIRFIRTADKLILKGYNTDAIGFENSLKPHLKPQHNKALILGTGGASKAIIYVLGKLGIECKSVSRTAQNGQLSYADLNENLLANYKLIVNATPLGTFPNTNACPDIPYQYLSNEHLLFDVVYNPSETLFMKKGIEKGAYALNGEAMLIGQAVAAWEIWNR